VRGCLRRLAACAILPLLFGGVACSKVPATSVDANAIGVWLGIAEPPPLPAVGIEVIVDPTDGSEATPARVREQLHAALLMAAARPGSFVRAWVLGADVTSLQMVGIQTSPRSASTRSERAAALAHDRFIVNADLYFGKAFEPVFSQTPPRRSLIAESVARVAWADAPNVQRIFIVLTDGREYSRFAHMDCGPIPDADAFTAALQHEHVLVPGSLQRARMILAGVDVTAVRDQRCAETIAKADEIRILWRHVLLGAGAASVTYTTGIADPDAVLTTKEAR
jgi:hypothetical protein